MAEFLQLNGGVCPFLCVFLFRACKGELFHVSLAEISSHPLHVLDYILILDVI